MLDYFLRGAKYLDTIIRYAVFRFYAQNTVIIRYNIILAKKRMNYCMHRFTKLILNNRVYEFIKKCYAYKLA